MVEYNLYVQLWNLLGCCIIGATYHIFDLTNMANLCVNIT